MFRDEGYGLSRIYPGDLDLSKSPEEDVRAKSEHLYRQDLEEIFDARIQEGFFPSRHGIKLSKIQCFTIRDELKHMSGNRFAFCKGSIVYTMVCTRPDVDRKSVV